MNQEPNDQYSDYPDDDQFPADSSKRRKGFFNLTGLGARLAATALAIGLGVVILSYAMSSSGDDPTAQIADSSPSPTVDAAPLATWTPGPTSVPPPPAEPTPEPAPEEGEPVAPVDPDAPDAPVALGIGSQVQVSGTGGFGVNMREGSGVTFAIVETLLDETKLEVIEGPVDGDGYTWWRVRLEDGREGWTVQDFMVPAN